MNAPAVLELPLDDALLKVLSSESRREILRLLRERRMTGAEMAARLELGKPAVAEHLKKLQDAELIERFDDPERRWVYYNLSARGRGILEPQRVRFYLVMAVAALALMVGVALALGLVVLMQGHGAADGLAGPGANSGSNLQGGAGQPGLPPGLAVPDVSVQHTLVPPTGPAQPGPAAAGPAGTPAAGTDSVIHGPARLPDPVGNTTPVAHPSLSLILDGPNGIGPLHANAVGQAQAETMVLVYRAQDIDPVNHTVKLHLLALNDTALAQANLTNALQGASTVPGVGLLVEIPDSVALPEADNSTATLAVQADAADSVAATGTLPLTDPDTAGPPATDSDTTGAETTGPTGPAAGDQGVQATDAAGPAITISKPAPVAGIGGPEQTATTAATLATVPAPATGSGQGIQGAQSGPGYAQVHEDALSGALDAAPPAGHAAPIPLVALLAAALMVSIYLPNRKK